MEPGLYILNYHDVSWEESLLTRGIYGTLRPDIFRMHLEWYRKHGDLISTRKALEKLTQGEDLKKPTFCLWFDDGFRGASRHALPICNAFNITAAQSINSRFVQRKEMYYLAKASYLNSTDSLRFLRSRIRKHYPDMPLKFRYWIKEVFSKQLIDIIDEVYIDFTTQTFRDDAFRIYDDEKGIQCLDDSGWLIANHTASHYPISSRIDTDEIMGEFEECSVLVRNFGDDNFWVSPFGLVHECHHNAIKERAILVSVGNRINTPVSFEETGVIYRFEPGMLRTPELRF